MESALDSGGKYPVIMWLGKKVLMNLPFKSQGTQTFLFLYFFCLLQDCAQSESKGVLDFRAVIISTEVNIVTRDHLLQQS